MMKFTGAFDDISVKSINSLPFSNEDRTILYNMGEYLYRGFLEDGTLCTNKTITVDSVLYNMVITSLSYFENVDMYYEEIKHIISQNLCPHNILVTIYEDIQYVRDCKTSRLLNTYMKIKKMC